MGIVDADVPPTIEKLSPAAPSTFTAALVLRFCFEACLTRDMVASSARFVKSPGKSALGETDAQGLPLPKNAKTSPRVPFIFMNEIGT